MQGIWMYNWKIVHADLWGEDHEHDQTTNKDQWFVGCHWEMIGVVLYFNIWRASCFKLMFYKCYNIYIYKVNVL